ncbi:MAG: SlyX family protein [Verrucomicrobiota bacterium]
MPPATGCKLEELRPSANLLEIVSHRQACFAISQGETLRMNDDVSERFTRLESVVAHLEHLAEQLNDVVTDQGRQLEQLKKRVELQAQTLTAIELERIKSVNPKPPHYQ